MRESLDNVDALLLAILASSAFAMRFWRLFFPAAVVFDECYFGNFSNHYIHSEFYYDIHPPLGKIVAFVFANLSEYDGSISFGHSPYLQGDYVHLRVTPALFSALCGPLVYFSVRFAHFSHTAAAVAGALTVFDTSLGTEGRHILSDGILHFLSVLHIAILMRTLSIVFEDATFSVWHIANGISLGAACCRKNRAWGLMAMDGFCYFVHLFRPSLTASPRTWRSLDRHLRSFASQFTLPFFQFT
jgi:dolichyl-phosphate-mannose--protein O-mannosyl transferase